jgi:hypothetical protein
MSKPMTPSISSTDADKTARMMVNWRNELLLKMGEAEYRPMIAGFILELQAVARSKNISILKAFEALCTKPLADGEMLLVGIFSAAVVEVYELEWCQRGTRNKLPKVPA